MAKKFFFFNQFFTAITPVIHNPGGPEHIQFTIILFVKPLKTSTKPLWNSTATQYSL
jgi:hypothetical protein